MAGILVLCYVLLFFFGAAVFSFCNVAALRIPEKRGFVSGRSNCPSCGKELKWYHTAPVFSYLFLRGKCAYCKQRISPRYLLWELLGGGLACLTFFLQCGDLLSLTALSFFRFLLLFVFFAVLGVVALIDGATMEIPNGAVFLLAGLGVLSVFLFPETGLLERGIGIVCVSVPFLLLALVIDGAFGGGDIKLMAACGLLLGWKLNLIALFFALLAGGTWGAWLLLTRRKGRKDQLAFGPFLCAGVTASALFGQQVLNWYLKFFTMT